MRAGLSTIQQTLTPEAANVLSHSIAEAGRRNHSQTTPLHVASTLLGSPSGFLRQACIKSHPNSSHPLQCRALELCFSVALERLPTAQGASPGLEPPISNALMAALKRAQAHQRRGCPEQQQQPLLAVKVELEQLIISILDDPSVSRVMREASFSSPAVKATIEQSLNSAAPAAAGTNSSPIGLGFRSPAVPTAAPPRNLYLNPRLQQQQQQQQQLGNSTQQRGEEVKRVIDILLRPKKRNPVLVGESEPEAVVKELLKRIENKELGDGLLKNIQVVPLDKEIGSDEAKIPTKFQELGDVLETKMGSSGGGGVVLDLGDLKWLVEQPAAIYGLSTVQPPQQFVSDKGRIMVAEMGKLLTRFEKSSCRLWLIGTATCETYLRCQVYHPLIENDWDLQAVPIAARSPLPGLFAWLGADGILGSSVESFSPLKNLPTTISASPRLLPENLNPARRMGSCLECTEKCEQEIARAASTELEKPSPEVESESGRSPLPQWLQNAKVHGSQNKFQTKDQVFLLQKQRSNEIQKKGTKRNESLRSPHRHQNRLYLHSCCRRPMELPMLLSFVQTLIEAHKLFLRKGRLMVSIAASTILLYSLLLLTNIFSLRPAVGQLIANTSLLLITSPTSTEYSYLLLSIQKDIRLFYGLEWVFVLLYSVCSILFSTVTIYASAASHGGKNLSAKDLGVAVARSWRRLFKTFFYITLFGIGYLFLVLALTIPPVLPQVNIATAILCIMAALLYAHLAVVWTLGLIVSVLEEDKSGLEALAKAGQLVKGRQVHGFVLSLVIAALSILMSQVMRLFSVPQSEGEYIAIGLVMLNSLWAVRMFGWLTRFFTTNARSFMVKRVMN